MSYKILPLFKSHYSLGKSILSLEEPIDKSGKPNDKSIFHLLKQNELQTLVLVDDNISGLLQASKVSSDNKIKLIYGLRIHICNDVNKRDDDALTQRAKYIIFAKNPESYKSLIKIWSFAAKDGFYYKPSIDFENLKKMWNKNLSLVIPFYDSFLYLNSFHSHKHIPDFSFTKPIFLTEDNNLPFDDNLKIKVVNYCKVNKCDILPAQSIYYKCSEDFLAYLTFRCIHSRGTSSKSTLEKPELKHMGSDEFNFEKWLKNNL